MSSRAPSAKMGSVVHSVSAPSGGMKIHPAAQPRPSDFPKVPTMTKTKSFGGPGGILRVPRVEK